MFELKIPNSHMIILIDDEDYDLVMIRKNYKYQKNKFNHWVSRKAGNNLFYAVCMVRLNKNKWKHIRMHQLITGFKNVDHKDGNGLNNQKSNLRKATIAQNTYNQRKRSGTYSRYKGVSKMGNTKKWRAYIVKNYKQYHLGLFEDEIDAAKEYNKKAKEFFGEFACLNQIQ